MKVFIRTWDAGRDHVLVCRFRPFDERRKSYWGLPSTKVSPRETIEDAVKRKLRTLGLPAIIGESWLLPNTSDFFIADVYNSGELPKTPESYMLESDWLYKDWLIPGHAIYGFHRGFQITEDHIRYIRADVRAAAPR